MQVFPYSESEAVTWDEVSARCPMATFLHTRRFLSYHGDRFRDVSLFLADEKGRVVGLFPAAVDPKDERCVVSHPGISFGGLLHAGELEGERMIEALESLRRYYAERGFESLRYKAVPHIYHQAPAADDLYALFRVGARRYRCDLSCAIDLKNPLPLSERRRRSLKKALKQGVKLAHGRTFIEPFWQVLEKNLARRFNLRPVHSVEEIKKLNSLFPDNIDIVVGLMADEVVGGVVVFNTPTVAHSQYTASNEKGQESCALDVVFTHFIEKAGERGARYFDFGVSTENDGQILNTGLYQYKSGFGGRGVVHEFYEVALNGKDSQK